ncbi:MAG: hypothetical protein ACI865_003363 [Flavobacteriaceae bacterium]|jgi:hypothetical protein
MKHTTDVALIKNNIPVIFFQFLILFLASSAISQENPWKTEKSGTNPWTGEVTESAEEIQPELSDSSVNTLPLKEISSQDLSLEKELVLVEYGNTEYKAPGAAIFSGVTSTFFSVFALPVNLLLTTTIQTPQQNLIVSNYQKENPEATAKEIKQIQKGMRKKRIMNSLKGSLIGSALNLGIIAIIIAL